jgi:hypothetical protein
VWDIKDGGDCSFNRNSQKQKKLKKRKKEIAKKKKATFKQRKGVGSTGTQRKDVPMAEDLLKDAEKGAQSGRGSSGAGM